MLEEAQWQSTVPPTFLFLFGRGDHAGIHGATSGMRLGTFPSHLAAMSLPLGTLLGALTLINGVGAFVHEVVAQGGDDD